MRLARERLTLRSILRLLAADALLVLRRWWAGLGMLPWLSIDPGEMTLVAGVPLLSPPEPSAESASPFDTPALETLCISLKLMATSTGAEEAKELCWWW